MKRWMNFAAAACLVVSAAMVSAQSGPYSVIAKWSIGGEGGWDYVTADPSKHVVYVTHGPRVEVVDTATGKTVGAITGLKGTHGVVLDSDGKYGYISDGGANELVVFDRKTYARVNSIPTGTNPDGIVYEPVTKTVWTFNGRSSDASVIDTATMKNVGTVKLSGKPEFPAADGKGMIFANIETRNSLVKIDAKAKTVVAEWPLAGCESPSGLAMDTRGGRLFSVCDGKKMAVTDAQTGKSLATPAIGEGPDAAGFDPKTGMAFSSNGEGTLTVVDASAGKYNVVQTLPTQKGGRTMTFDEGTGRVYIVVAEQGPRPAPTTENPRPRPAIVPGSFSLLVVGRK